eukprot:349681-Chlamydomonas_euryale.AAC.5
MEDGVCCGARCQAACCSNLEDDPPWRVDSDAASCQAACCSNLEANYRGHFIADRRCPCNRHTSLAQGQEQQELFGRGAGALIALVAVGAVVAAGRVGQPFDRCPRRGLPPTPPRYSLFAHARPRGRVHPVSASFGATCRTRSAVAPLTAPAACAPSRPPPTPARRA